MSPVKSMWTLVMWKTLPPFTPRECVPFVGVEKTSENPHGLHAKAFSVIDAHRFCHMCVNNGGFPWLFNVIWQVIYGLSDSEYPLSPWWEAVAEDQHPTTVRREGRLSI